MEAVEGGSPEWCGGWVLFKVVAFPDAGMHDGRLREVEVVGVDVEAVGPAGSAWEDVSCVVAGVERGWEELCEREEPVGLPGLVDVAVLVDAVPAGGDEFTDPDIAGVKADLEYVPAREVDEVDAPVLQHARRVADAFPA